MGLSVSDFSRMTPTEFNAIYKEWQSRQEDNERGRWERCRWICYYALKPYAKKGLKPEDVLKFGWDKTQKSGVPKTKMTKAEQEDDMKEFKQLEELWKDE